MAQRILIAFTALMLLTSVAVAQFNTSVFLPIVNNPPTVTPEPTHTPQPTETPQPTATTIVPTATTGPTIDYSLSGTGDQLSQVFTLQPGLYLAESHYVGRSNFIIRLLDADGKYVTLLANEIGNADAVKAFYVETTKSYVIEVQSEGSWNITFRRPSRQEIERGPVAPTSLTGQGDRTIFIKLPAGLNRFAYSHVGRSNFIVRVIDLQGDYVGLAANEIGDSSGSRGVSVPREGWYYLEIQADGSWTINVSK